MPELDTASVDSFILSFYFVDVSINSEDSVQNDIAVASIMKE